MTRTLQILIVGVMLNILVGCGPAYKIPPGSEVATVELSCGDTWLCKISHIDGLAYDPVGLESMYKRKMSIGKHTIRIYFKNIHSDEEINIPEPGNYILYVNESQRDNDLDIKLEKVD